MNIKLHPRALVTEIGFTGSQFSDRIYAERGYRTAVRTAFDNDGRDRQGGPESIVSAATPNCLHALPDNELLAVVALMQYVHECGEHVAIEGLELNHHKPRGLITSGRLVKHVVAWLDELAPYDLSNRRTL